MKKRILACLLALVMLTGLLPVTALAVDAGGTTVPMLDVSKSKTATALDANGQTQITLSLPSAEMKKTLDVVFVVDNAFQTDNNTAAIQARGLVNELEKISKDGNLNVNAGLIVSGGYVPVLHSIPLAPIATTSEGIRDALDASETSWKQTLGRKGSNIQAGIENAREMLNDETEADKENKYLILISDGGAFSWYDKTTNTTWAKFFQVHRSYNNQDYYHWCNPGDFGARYTEHGETIKWNRSFEDLMKMSESDVDAYSIARPDNSEWNHEDGHNYSQYEGYYEAEKIKPILDKYPNGFAEAATVLDMTNDYVTSREAALYHTTKSIEAASEEANVIFVSFAYYYETPDHHKNSNLFTYTEAFKNYVESKGYVKLYRVNGDKDKYKYPINYQVTDTAKVFENIQNDLVHLVAAGSKVEDTIGSNFQLVSIDSLTVDGQPLTRAEKTGDTYTFGDTTKTDRFVVTYDDTTKMLTWNINETITKANTVQLKYTLKLTNPKSAAGTNGVNDLNGDGKEDATGKVYAPAEALYTNENAYLFPKDSTNHDGKKQEFPKPSVAVDENAIPDYLLPILNLKKAAPKLNTRDHFAYVQGYPDGTVKPAGSITRAEVAAILFRLMDADSRSLYYSTASGFRDVDSTKWYNTYVATLNNAGVITDSRTGYFRPNDAITRAELAAMLAQFAEKKSAAIYFSDISAGYWAANAIALTANLGWINGYPDGTFGPDKTVTRAELMAMVNRATGRAPESADALLPNMKTWKDNADTARWYYLDVQEATNSHTYTGAPTETWTSLTATPDWSQYE